MELKQASLATTAIVDSKKFTKPVKMVENLKPSKLNQAAVNVTLEMHLDAQDALSEANHLLNPETKSSYRTHQLNKSQVQRQKT